MAGTSAKPETAYDFGYSGTAEAVRGLALLPLDIAAKGELLEGCLDAYDEGRKENLQAFFAGYVSAKMKTVAVPGDRILQDYFLRPVMALTLQSETPYGALRDLLGGMTPEVRQSSLDLLLRHACINGNVKMARLTLVQGADAEAGGKQPVLGVASSKLPEKIKKELLEVLHLHGANLDKACKLPVKQAEYLTALQAEFNQKRAVGFRAVKPKKMPGLV